MAYLRVYFWLSGDCCDAIRSHPVVSIIRRHLGTGVMTFRAMSLTHNLLTDPLTAVMTASEDYISSHP